MESPLESFYLSEEEPLQSALLAMRALVKSHHPEISEALKWGLPTFYYKNHFFAYLYKDPHGKKLPYLGFNKGRDLDHPLLETGGRKLIKVLSFHPEHDLPAKGLRKIMDMAIALHEK